MHSGLSFRGPQGARFGRAAVKWLLFVEMAVPLAAASSIEVGGAPLELGAAREATLSAMRGNHHFMTTRLPDGRWVVSDRVAKRALAILSFDSKDKLVQVEKNWTPGTQSSADFAGALFQIVEQAQSAAASPCQLTASQHSLIGPNTALRDPGKPDLNVRQLDLVCGRKNFHIYINEPTAASLATKDIFEIPHVLLYESISQPSVEPLNRVAAGNSPGAGSQLPEQVRNTSSRRGMKPSVRVRAVSN